MKCLIRMEAYDDPILPNAIPNEEATALMLEKGRKSPFLEGLAVFRTRRIACAVGIHLMYSVPTVKADSEGKDY